MPRPPLMMSRLLKRLGGISPRRICMKPEPGTATVADVIRMEEKYNRLFELVDATLVEKVMGLRESLVAGEISYAVKKYVKDNGNPGVVSGEAGTIKLLGALVRIPDVAFIAWDRFPNRQVPAAKVPEVVPNLAVEVLSRGNTVLEMERKLKEYFLAGVDLVWFVSLEPRMVKVFTSPDNWVQLTDTDTLSGGTVLPGFTIPVADLFATLPPDPPSP